eukprot:TRINITY_DN9501_c0_g2_i4.p1 TRINITY_DN9501_c0_g2~~TRINITY_DN9501_c0_g2_i4.p1  ORF type:complete len:497 (+),score=145.20 TRINITY_DN9501_c0_g2_i4:264-1754(+)
MAAVRYADDALWEQMNVGAQTDSPISKKRIHEDDAYDLDNDDENQMLVPSSKTSKRETGGAPRTPFGENRRSSIMGKCKKTVRRMSRSLSQRGGSLRGGSFRRKDSTRRLSRIDSRDSTASLTRNSSVKRIIEDERNHRDLDDFIMTANEAEIKGLSETEQKLRHIMAELIDGEIKLNNEMHHVLKIYVDSSLMQNGDTISQATRERIFVNYADLYTFSSELLDAWHAASRTASGLPMLAAALVDWLPKVKQAYSLYCSQQRRAKHLLRRLLEEEWFADYDTRASRCHQAQGRTLMAMLDHPRNRLQQYKLLMERLAKASGSGHEEYAMQQEAILACHDAVSYVDKHAPSSMSDKVVELVQGLGSTGPGFDAMLEELVYVTTAVRDEKSEVNVYLFEQHLLLTKNRRKVKAANAEVVHAQAIVGKAIAIPFLQVHDMDDEDDVQVALASSKAMRASIRRQSMSRQGCVLKFASPDEKARFMTTQLRLQEACLEADA